MLVNDRRGPLWDPFDGASIPTMADSLREALESPELPNLPKMSIPYHLAGTLERMNERFGLLKKQTLTESAQDFEDDGLVIGHSSRVNPEDEDR